MELGTCFVREDILLRDGVRKIDGRKKNEEVAYFIDFAREYERGSTLEGTIEVELKRDVGK